MKTETLNKISAMTAAAGSAPHFAAIGELLRMLGEDPEAERAILETKKTIKECYTAMEKHAREHKTGSSYCFTPRESVHFIGNFFGIKPVDVAPVGTANRSSADVIDLDDLI